MYIYICICIRICICICICRNMYIYTVYTYVYIYRYRYVCIYMYIYIYICVYMCICIYMYYIYVCVRSRVPIYGSLLLYSKVLNTSGLSPPVQNMFLGKPVSSFNILWLIIIFHSDSSLRCYVPIFDGSFTVVHHSSPFFTRFDG